MCYRMPNHTTTGDGRVFGTWDFKWPQGSTIRVAFQDLPPDQKKAVKTFVFMDANGQILKDGGGKRLTGFAALTYGVQVLARQWLIGKPNINFEFDHQNLLPAPSTRRIKGGPPASASVFTPEQRQAANKHPHDYDVLVSFANLPVFQAREELNRGGTGAPTVPKRYFLPGSELGRYAQRIDYGTPTTFVGKREHFEGNSLEYFNSPEFRHWAIHEFGHVLGLVHEHQNPQIHPQILKELRDGGDLVKILSEALGYGKRKSDVTPREIKDEITGQWPVVRDGTGKILYCDFREYGPHEGHDDSTSIMFHVFWQRLLKDGDPNAPARFLPAPCARDLTTLAQMYPTAPERRLPPPPPGTETTAPRIAETVS